MRNFICENKKKLKNCSNQVPCLHLRVFPCLVSLEGWKYVSPLLSINLLFLCLDSTEKKSSTTVNHKTLTSPRKTVNKLMRHFRQTPKGFCHTVKHGKLSSSSSSVHIWRKPRKYLKDNLQLKSMTAEEKDLLTNSVSVEQLLNDESFWDTWSRYNVVVCRKYKNSL